MKNISLYVALVYIMHAWACMEVRGGHRVGCRTHPILFPWGRVSPWTRSLTGFSDTESTACALADWAVLPTWKLFLTLVLHCSKLTVFPESQQCSVSFSTEPSFSDWPVGVLLLLQLTWSFPWLPRRKPGWLSLAVTATKSTGLRWKTFLQLLRNFKRSWTGQSKTWTIFGSPWQPWKRSGSSRFPPTSKWDPLR